jgi:hypothetical protein
LVRQQETEEMMGSFLLGMELTTEEKRRLEDDDRRRVSEKQYRAKVRAELQGELVQAQKSSLPWMLGISLVLAVVAIWFVDHFGR